MSKNTLIELSKCSIRVAHHQEVYTSCSNDSIIALTSEGINVFNYSHNLRCSDKQVDHSRFFIPVLKKSPATCLFQNSDWKRNIKNSQMTEMILDPALWPHNLQLMEEATRVLSAIWSPAGIIQDKEQVLAVLNCTGNVDIYAQNLNKWINILDLSSLVSEQFSDILKKHHDFESIRKAAYSVVTQSICWASEKNDNNTCYFITAQRNGNILIWSLLPKDTNIQGNYVGKIDSYLDEIVYMVWIQKSKNEFLLLCSEIKGQLIAFNCEISNNELSCNEKHKIWTENDQMLVKLIHYYLIGNYLVIIFNKNRHIVIKVYDKNLSLHSQIVKKLNDFRITSFAESRDGLIISTVNCKMFILTIDFVDDNFDMNVNPIEIINFSPTIELYSVSLTKNNLIYVLGTADRKMAFKKEPDLSEVIFATTEANLNNIMGIILNNPTKKLTDQWDCIELLRYKVHKTKKMPELDYNQLYIDGENDAYKLKVYLILLYFYIELGVMKNYYLKLPQTSVDYVKERLLVHHAISLINNLENNYRSNGVWNGNDVECIVGAKTYLEFFCCKYKKNIKDLLNTRIFDEIKSKFNYICQCCEEEIKRFTCRNGHINMLCSLTFTPILSDNYLICKTCGITARTDLGILEPYCVFCDFRLYKYH